MLYASAGRQELIDQARGRAQALVEGAADRIRGGTGGLCVTTRVLEGMPREAILDEAQRWGAELILVGSHGHSALRRFLLGSVSHAVALHAPCSVEIVRCRGPEARG